MLTNPAVSPPDENSGDVQTADPHTVTISEGTNLHHIAGSRSCSQTFGLEYHHNQVRSSCSLRFQLKFSLLIFRIYTIEFYPRTLKGKAFGLCKAISSFAAIFSALPLNHEILLGDSLLGSWKKHDIWEG